LLKSFKNNSQQTKRINIRISERDISELKKKALDEGISCQTFVTDIIHKYVTDKLKSVFDSR